MAQLRVIQGGLACPAYVPYLIFLSAMVSRSISSVRVGSAPTYARRSCPKPSRCEQPARLPSARPRGDRRRNRIHPRRPRRVLRRSEDPRRGHPQRRDPRSVRQGPFNTRSPTRSPARALWSKQSDRPRRRPSTAARGREQLRSRPASRRTHHDAFPRISERVFCADEAEEEYADAGISCRRRRCHRVRRIALTRVRVARRGSSAGMLSARIRLCTCRARGWSAHTAGPAPPDGVPGPGDGEGAVRGEPLSPGSSGARSH